MAGAMSRGVGVVLAISPGGPWSLAALVTLTLFRIAVKIPATQVAFFRLLTAEPV